MGYGEPDVRSRNGCFPDDAQVSQQLSFDYSCQFTTSSPILAGTGLIEEVPRLRSGPGHFFLSPGLERRCVPTLLNRT